MKAILLAAGVGKRMGPNAPPKCLLQVAGKSLLERSMETLRGCGILNLVLVVGYRAQEVVSEARARASRIHLTILENPRYREGAILSLWLARGQFDDAVIVMDADVLFPPAGFKRLVQSPQRNCILVDSSSADTGEEQMVFGTGDRVFHIMKRPTSDIRQRLTAFGEAVGFLKLTREAARLLGQLLDEKVREGIVDIEHEQVYPDLFKRVSVGFEKTEGLPWAEIDTPHDLERAQQLISPRV